MADNGFDLPGQILCNICTVLIQADVPLCYIYFSKCVHMLLVCRGPLPFYAKLLMDCTCLESMGCSPGLFVEGMGIMGIPTSIFLGLETILTLYMDYLFASEPLKR